MNKGRGNNTIIIFVVCILIVSLGYLVYYGRNKTSEQFGRGGGGGGHLGGGGHMGGFGGGGMGGHIGTVGGFGGGGMGGHFGEAGMAGHMGGQRPGGDHGRRPDHRRRPDHWRPHRRWPYYNNFYYTDGSDGDDGWPYNNYPAWWPTFYDGGDDSADAENNS